MLLEIAKKFGTPLYVYDSKVIDERCQNLTTATGGLADIFYSLKANPNIAIAQLLKTYGANAEVCSLSELMTALEVGFLPENIIFVGPCKSDEEVKLALEHNIYAIVCESVYELKRVDEIAQKSGKIASILLRINPDFYVEKAPLKMGGVPSQFGVDLTELMIDSPVQNFSHLKLKGIHVYNGTRILDAEGLAKNMEKIFALAEKLSKDWEVKFECLDLGGGFGVPYFDNEKPLDIERLTALLAPLFQNSKQKYPKMRLIIESGRYLVAESGAFISKVCDVKQSHGEHFLVTDGGMNCHMAATGIGSLLKRNFPIMILSHPEARKIDHNVRYNITGPLCTPGDLIGRDVMLPKMKIGDFVAILVAGAYGPSASPVLFLSHGHPAEVLIYKGEGRLIRKKDNASDILQNQIKMEEM